MKVIGAIRDGIYSGDLMAGDHLTENVLGTVLKNAGVKVSRMPIRAALARLQNLGIVAVKPKKGTWLVRLTREEINEVWSRRWALEEFALLTLAGQQRRNLDEIEKMHQKWKVTVGKYVDLDGEPNDEDRRCFIAYDENFHESISVAAGYPLLAEELKFLRLKLRLASNSKDLLNTKRRMYEIVEEHGEILVALDGGGIRPDLNRVRFTFLNHFRKAGQLSWKIRDSIPRSGPSYLFNLPNLPSAEEERTIPQSNLVGVRLFTELCAVWNLTTRRGTRLESVEAIHDAMKERYMQAVSEGAVSTDLWCKFYDHDIEFHATLCYLGGILFGEELITFVWRKMRGFESIKSSPEAMDLNPEKMARILRDHEDILEGIRMHNWNDTRDAMVKHLCLAFRGKKVAAGETQVDTESPTGRELRDIAKHLNDMADHVGTTSTA
ncbi:MAG TPA: FCD domain-containing protein [Tepidisphaeraceae bacterium]|nr:FCD domain-containing protein [Tepidisphaeraceae bacterium]